jgi:hypothetical protein
MHANIPYQRLISSVRGPNNYFLLEPTIRRVVEYFLDNSAKSILLLKVTTTDLYRLKIIFDHFGVEEKHFRKSSAGQVNIYFLTKLNAGTV